MVGTTVAVSVQSAVWMGIGQFVNIQSGGYYNIASGSVPTFSIINLGFSGYNAPVGSGIATGLAYPGGLNGLPGGTKKKVSSYVTSNYNVNEADYIIAVGTLTGNITITLPPNPTTGDTYVVKDTMGTCQQFARVATGTSGQITSVGNSITVKPNSGKIDGLNNNILTNPYEALEIVFTGNGWSII